MPLPLTVSCFSKIRIGFTFLVPAHPGSPGKRAVKRVCVCVCVTQLASSIKSVWGSFFEFFLHLIINMYVALGDLMLHFSKLNH